MQALAGIGVECGGRDADLSAAVDDWCASSRSAPSGHVIIAAAASKGGLDEAAAAELELDRDAVAIAEAIESPIFAGETILTGAAVLLGHSGIAACEADAGRMRKPLVVVLVEREDSFISWLIATVEITMH